MRRGCLFGGFFWGLVLILLGITLFLNVTFHISIPIFQILFAAFFVYLGVRILTGRRRWRHGWEHWGGDRSVDLTRSGDRHDTVFGRSDVDLTGIQPKDTTHVDVSAVFGATVVRISPATPVKVLVSVAFGSVRLPSGNAEAFGEYTWRSPGLDESKPHLVLHAAAVFGSVRIDAR
jgi:predicted membrane protein